MKLIFDPNQQYQQEAINSVVSIFEGQPIEDALFSFNIGYRNMSATIPGVGNSLLISDEQIFKNLQAVQQGNDLPVSGEVNGMNFSVEMETGTGKTYVYLRTVYELFSLYGFKKYVIVVPSVAIREGVLKNLKITHDHFQNLYDNVPVNHHVYDSSKVSALRGFATSNNIEILVMNIDAFAKDENIINRPNDRLSGQKPVDFIRTTRPVVIVDEPQNMETEKRKKAIAGLNPLCTLRYSATHRDLYNLVYSLNPVKAYDLGLVKQIVVDSITEEDSFNYAFVSLDEIRTTKTKLTARVSIDVNEPAGVKRKRVSVKVGDDLFKLSGERNIYGHGYLVEEIDALNECLSLSNGTILYKGQSQGGMTDQALKFQMRRTIEEHLRKERSLAGKGIKVLSLFFIDRVANYRSYDQQGNPVPGKYVSWFEEIYSDLVQQPGFSELNRFPMDQIHDGYFSTDKKGRFKDTSGETKADDDTYRLIMQDKERLLDINTPLRFIFAHSALREGWDNPNVFQICTLNETKSEIKKRQEIGRGLRLAVDQTGNRVYDRNVNQLLVVANESYEDFAKDLQKEIEEECGVEFKSRIKNKNRRIQVKYRKGFEADPLFLSIWEKIRHKTRYQVDYDTDELIRQASREISRLPEIKSPVIRSTKVRVDMTDSGIETLYVGDRIESYDGYSWEIPDILGYIQARTELTRTTIKDILTQSGRVDDVIINPQLFLDLAVQSIKKTLHHLMIDGIKYQKIGSEHYSMTLFESEELETYLNEFFHKIQDSEKTIYLDYIPLDSGVENRFARDCESSEQVRFYFKLPSWFKISTPIGNYNPDWAVVFENDRRVYFVAETKDTGTDRVDISKLTMDEQLKIKCGKAHFRHFEGVEYKVVNRVGQLAG